ncbi:NTP transferase domain-containing protein [Candidatus Gottesmanbacteria bacterium]|nr:NTP transferase domain-containing protein [Candidatus Gottesmanbacteria bacterium]
MKNLTAVILAAGIGERFWPFERNKVLFPFFGKTFFDWAVKDMLPREVTKVVIVADPPHAKFFQLSHLGRPTVVVTQKEPGSMADALMSAEPELRDTALLVIIADDLVDTDLYTRVIAHARSQSVFGVIPAWLSESYFPGGYLTLRDKKVTGITEKPGVGKEPSKWVNVSGHFIAQSDVLFDVLKKMPKSDIRYELALTKLMSEKEFTFEPYTGKLSSLKYPWQVLDVLSQLFSRVKNHKGKNVEIGEGTIVQGNVFIEDNVRIFDHTKIIGPAYIGENTIIGTNNLIRESHIGADCVTGFNTDITRSYVGNSCWFHRNYVGDSVLEEDISMGSGSVLANLRLDEAKIYSSVKGTKTDTGKTKLGAMIGPHVRIGVNASIMPGVKIGTNSFVGAGVVLDKDLPEDCFCTLKPGYTVKRNTRSLAGKSRNDFKKRLSAFAENHDRRERG